MWEHNADIAMLPDKDNIRLMFVKQWIRSMEFLPFEQLSFECGENLVSIVLYFSGNILENSRPIRMVVSTYVFGATTAIGIRPGNVRKLSFSPVRRPRFV